MSETTAVQSESGKAHRRSSPRLADFRVLVVPGLHGSGPDHWQSRWQRLYPSFERVEQDRWDTPDLPVWSQRLLDVLQRDARPTLIVAHSFGCLTTVYRAAADAGLIAGALLVAPADPVKFSVADSVQVALPFPSIVVGSGDDPWMTAERAQYWAGVWGSEFVYAGEVGHINSESGLGDWVEGQEVLGRLVARSAPFSTSASVSG
ncbi:alpha/beta hydrolase [Herbaspirillum sp. meg3]|uniref:RBBP9/YdeN family alpha/beta hydrolase n=1 Tax=Herbaspirillum sp. meg3 TaxID=2025949 RepID=UPI000B99BAE4|nr:alpha/beta hydrolase [Herbaspirillum sp. meg3]ASU39374.1 alpha/beta hydrolase [Herbaspirillum sp. meg3]